MAQTLFSTQLYRTKIKVIKDLESTCLAIAREDKAGRAWSRPHHYTGYTSYASLDDLMTRARVFADLERVIAKHVARFAKDVEF